MVNKQQYAFPGVILVLIAVWSSEAQDLKTPWLVHTTTFSINGLEMDHWSSDRVITGLYRPDSVDYHFTQGYLYWTAEYNDWVSRANLSNTADREDLVTNSRSKADGMAVDWIYNHIYWIDTTHKHIKMANLDGSLEKTLIDRDLVLPRAIVVDPNAGWLFFTDVSNHRIIRCGLDGSDIKTIVSNIATNISEPNGLSIDFSSKRLYWIDSVYKQIQSSNLNGTDIIKLLTTSPEYMALARGLIVFRDWIYWISSHKIYRAYKENGSNVEVIKSNLYNARGIKIYSPENQPTGDNVCGQNNGDCEQLCLQSPQSTIKCACADGFKLKNDSKSCLDIGSGNWLTFVTSRKIERLDVETSVIENIATGQMYANALDIHYNKGFVYWTDYVYGKIMRSSVTKDSVSGVVEDVVTEEIITPRGIAVDWIYDLLYWTDSGYDHIQVSRLNGTGRRTIIKDDSIDEPRAIVVDPIRGWLFFSVGYISARIDRCRMDGTDRIVIVEQSIALLNGMSIDNVGERLYWVDSHQRQIKSIKFDGYDLLVINITIMMYPFDLVVFDSYVYWTDLRNRSIYKINQYTGQNLTLVASNVGNARRIHMFGAGAQVNGSNLCGDNNGMCSHICFPLPAYDMSKSTKTGCMCPDFFTLEADNNTCTEIERPSIIMINVTRNSSISITWTLPVTSSDVIQQTDVILYLRDNDMVYKEVVYSPHTSLIIGLERMTSCAMYTLKLRCKYHKGGWTQYQEEKFWATDNIIYGEKDKHVVISWTTKVDRSNYNVAFNQLSNQTDDLIYSEGRLQKNSSKYKYFNKTGLHIQFTLTQVNELDVGLYKSMPTWNWYFWPLIDGCAFLVMEDKPQKPNITFDKYPFVNDQTIFTCMSRVQRWPTFVPYSLQYNWTVAGGVRNILTIYNVSKLDKGKHISCRATDDNGLISDSSEVITLDPYYGPDNIALSISGDHVSVTQGRQLGPITCSAVCYPECDYIWKHYKNGAYSNVTVGQSFTIHSASMDNIGFYICYVTHKNDSSRISTIAMTIYVKDKPTTSTVKQTTSTDKSTASTVKPTTSTDKPTASTVASMITTNSTAIMSNPSNKNVDNGDDTKDAIIYSVVGSVIVIGIVAALSIFYYRKRRHQCISEPENRNDINLAYQMERENPDECDL